MVSLETSVCRQIFFLFLFYLFSVCFLIKGCGTGKYLTLQSDLFTIGCDRSQQLCELVREQFVHVPIVIADNLHLPYRENLFDAVLSIGVIHHLATHQRRVQAIRGLTSNCFNIRLRTNNCLYRMLKNSET